MEVRSEQETAFTLSMQKEQSMRLAYSPDGTAIYKPISSPSPFQTTTGVSSGGNGTVAMGETTDAMNKKKRGRPRKYGPDGSRSPYLVRIGPGSVGSQDGLNSLSAGGAGRPISSSSGNPDGKKRGRPPGSTNKKQHTHLTPLGSGGIGFTPHVITVKAGEDVSSKIMSFSENGARAVCVLSANGAISNVTLQQAATFGRTVTSEGWFEILSLSGSYKLSESGCERSVLSVSLAGPDGRVLGGAVAGLLTAASPVQVIIGSFIAQGANEANKKKKKEKKEKMKHQVGPADQTNRIAPGGGVMGRTSPPSRGTVSESSGGPNNSFNQSNNNINVNSGQPSFSGIHWK